LAPVFVLYKPRDSQAFGPQKSGISLFNILHGSSIITEEAHNKYRLEEDDDPPKKRSVWWASLDRHVGVGVCRHALLDTPFFPPPSFSTAADVFTAPDAG
jgi:hypothetical protein